jgi:hypothetical protein
MASNDDEILLGARVLTGKVPDTDGDGVSDAEEALAGTDPQDASDHPDRDPILKPRDDDPRGDLGREGIERETTFDPAANMPEGTTIDSGLDGMANLDGSDLSKGQNHFGVGEDELLQGRGGHENPLDMQRDPAATSPRPTGPPPASQAAVGWSDDGASKDVGATGGSTPPPGADVSTRAPNSDLVSGEKGGADGGSFLDHPIDNTLKIFSDAYSGGGTPEPPDTGTKRPDGDTPIPKPKPKKPVQPGSSDDYNVNPDADAGGGAPTDAELARAIVVHGGDTKPVDGQGAGPQVDADAPPPPKIDLVRDGGDQAGDLDMTQALVGAPDAPVVHTINPDSGAAPTVIGGGPGPSGGDGVDDMSVVVDHTAVALGGDGLQAMDGAVDLGSVVDSHLDIDVGLAPEEGVPQDEGAFAGPLDDGFD